MNKQSIILMVLFSWSIFFSSCNKRDEIRPEENAGVGIQAVAVTCAYTIKASESTVDGSKLNLPPGSIVCIEAGTRGPLYLKNFKGEPGRPITFINSSSGQAILKGNGGPWALKVGYSSNIRFTGTGSSSEFGIVIDGGNNGFTLPELTTDFEIDHVEVKNCGFAGIMGKTDPKCDQATWRENFEMRNVSLHDNYIHDVKGEGFYIGNSFYNGKSESCGTVYPHEIKGLRIFKNVIKNVGCEGIQVGCATTDVEIYENYIENPGREPFASYQNNGLQIGAGTGGKCYNNIIKNAPGNGMIVNGVGGNMVYNNLIVNSGALGIFCDERTEPKEGFNFINNTIVNCGSDGMRLYCEQVPMNNIINNIIINPKSGRFINTSSGVKINSQNNYFNMDVASAKFVNASAGNYTLQDGSPAINAGIDVVSFGIVNDLNNSIRPFASKCDIGAYEYNGIITNPGDPTPNPTPDPGPNPDPDPVAQKVATLTLINADTDKDIAVLTEGYVIDYAKIGTKNINIRANTDPTTVGSVVFGLDNNSSYRVETWAPYAIGMDGGAGKYDAWTLSEGNHSISATPYSSANGAGTKGTALSINVKVQNGTIPAPNPDPVPAGQSVTSLTLINADTDKDIAVLTNGYVIDYAKIGTKNINIRANTNPAIVGSVVFGLNTNPNYRVETWAPYAMGMDGGAGKYNAWTLPVGNHTLIATPYSSGNAGGTKGTALTINVVVQNGTTPTEPNPDPGPNPTPEPGTQLKLYPSDDAYLDGTKRYNNSLLRVDAGKRVSYVKYQVNGLGTAKPVSAKIRLKVDGDAGAGNVKVGKGSHSNWTENTITYSNKPSIASPVASLNSRMDIGNVYELDVTSAITGDGTYTFIITMDAGGSDFALSSSEGSFKPELLINK